jgi:hypothetical protein
MVGRLVHAHALILIDTDDLAHLGYYGAGQVAYRGQR